MKENGLTVGELTITVSALLIIAFIWTSCSKDDPNQETTYNQNFIESIQVKRLNA
tara:strand:+ start:205 stop:369 length:165 start_codon:yes stop_codon:yes gene_type:complete